RGRQVEVAGLDPVFVGCSGTYQAGLLAAGGAVFAADSAEVGYVRGRLGTIIVSDGEVKIGVISGIALVIARGTVTCDGPWNGRVITGKKVLVTGRGRLGNCEVAENEPLPLGFVK